MAKTEQETLDLLNLMVDIYDAGRAHCLDLMSDLELLKDEILVGSPGEWSKIMEHERRQMEAFTNNIWTAYQLLMETIHMPLGELAGSNAPTGSASVNISKFNDYLKAQADSIDSHTSTKGAFTPDGGNTGTGEVVQLTTGADLVELDCMHNETIELTCEGIGPQGRPQFRLEGSEVKFFDFDPDNGNGNADGGYKYDWGSGLDDFTRAVNLISTSSKNNMVAWSADDHRNMVINGNLEATIGSGTTKVKGATILTGDTDVTSNVATPILGSQSLNADADFEMEFPIIGSRVGIPEFIAMLVRRTGTKTGNFKFGFRSDVGGVATDHFDSGNIDITTWVAGTVYRLKLAFTVPKTLGENPRLFITLASSGSTGSIDFDDIVKGVLSLYDSSRAIAILDGATKFRKGDKFTAAQTMTAAAPFQRMFNECFGRGVYHNETPSFWIKT